MTSPNIHRPTEVHRHVLPLRYFFCSGSHKGRDSRKSSCSSVPTLIRDAYVYLSIDMKKCDNDAEYMLHIKTFFVLSKGMNRNTRARP